MHFFSTRLALQAKWFLEVKTCGDVGAMFIMNEHVISDATAASNIITIWPLKIDAQPTITSLFHLVDQFIKKSFVIHFLILLKIVKNELFLSFLTNQMKFDLWARTMTLTLT